MPHASFCRYSVLLAALAIGGFSTAGHGATLRTLHSFCSSPGCADGLDPSAGLATDAAGDLYGTTAEGGHRGDGVAYKLLRIKNHFKFEVIYTFCERSACTDGNEPLAGLVVDTNGNLYGTTAAGGAGSGIAFELSPKETGKNYRLKVLYTFCSVTSCRDGATPEARLTYAGAATGALYDGVSPLYGSTTAGGGNNGGIAFRLAPHGNRWRLTVMHDFCTKPKCADGSAPHAPLMVDGSGTLFGTTTGGGKNLNGAVFELVPNATRAKWSEQVLYSFCSAASCSDGRQPIAGVIEDATGNLFGTTLVGGTSCPKETCGVVFRLDPATSAYAARYDFCTLADCADGSGPRGDLAMDSSGNLYGTTTQGGGNDIDDNAVGGGTIFQLNGTILQTLHSFCTVSACADGEYPQDGLIRDSAGNLFGTTLRGGTGANSAGTVFELVP
jgi:uncharacterized repeat protein (TIGR03803 family)